MLLNDQLEQNRANNFVWSDFEIWQTCAVRKHRTEQRCWIWMTVQFNFVDVCAPKLQIPVDIINRQAARLMQSRYRII